jgi:hypothetical protein
MKTKDVQVGKRYTAKVSDRLVAVEVLDGPVEKHGRLNSFRVRNLHSGRVLEMTATRLRDPVLSSEERQAARAEARERYHFVEGSSRSSRLGFGYTTSAAKRGYLVGFGVL